MGKMNVILSLNDYSIYQNDKYYLCIPNKTYSFYHVFMGFSLEDLNILSEELVINEIRKISDSINVVYKNSVYILPIIKPSVLIDAACENDDKQYNYILQNIIQPITLSVYGKLVSDNKRVSQIIKMIKQNDSDKKLIGWLSMKLGNNFIKEINFENKIDESMDDDLTNEIDDKFKSLAIEHEIDDIWIKKEEDRIADTLKPAFSPGFSALKFLIMTLVIFLVLGSIIAYLIIK